MAKIIIHQQKIKDSAALISLCPFAAIELVMGRLEINSGCKMCRICLKKGPAGVFELVEEERKTVDKSAWRGIAVYADRTYGHIHPVTLELIGKAREMAARIGHPVYCLLIGGSGEEAVELLHYGVDEVFRYDDPELQNFRIEPFAAVFEDFIGKIKPAVMLVGGTEIGRSLAPRMAARFRTGLTADCTVLDIQPDTDLDQIRPAFGGNIMAHIRTPRHRPQFATVRYKIFSAPERMDKITGKINECRIAKEKLGSRIRLLERQPKPKARGIEDAEILVVAGRGFKKQDDLRLIRELALALNAEIAATRPLIEAGWADPRTQIGLSGRTVKPKLIVTCGVSGSVQFVAGMKNSTCIVAINQDRHAPIMQVAHYGIIGNIYEVIPDFIEKTGKSRMD
ncbi:MAG: electron transfer flavoprotein subunit alpha/FixB family protein [Candidatus Wallbacteria bacterium]|nr:electron transfer flavoprotein subunit alpha/FixB family protein [Candidatus Wallbacteria bacterium]